jgi:diguanylate cyclase (GGDEF)-like protein
MDWQLLGSRPPNQGERFQDRRWQRCLGGGMAALIAIALQALGLLSPLEKLAYISLFKLRGAQAWDDRLVLVAIDEAAIAELDRNNWSRQEYTKLLDRLAVAQPRVVVLDMVLQKPTDDDSALAAAMRDRLAAILAVAWNKQGEVFQSAPELRAAAAAQGHIVKQEDSDGLMRRIVPEIHETPALGIATTQTYFNQHYPLNLPQHLWINWPGNIETLTTYSFKDVIDQPIAPDAFRDKIVLIGTTAEGFDPVATPFNLNPPASGIHLHAATIHNLLQNNFLHPWGENRALALPLYGIAGIILSLAMSRHNLLPKLAMGWGLGASWCILTVASFHVNILLPVAPPLVLIFCAGAIATIQDRLSLDATLQRQEYQLQKQTLYDTLTGLPNRTLFMEYLKAAAARAQQQSDFTFAVLFLDLDRFKVINAHRGHQAGDLLLAAIAHRLKQWTQSYQYTVYRDTRPILARFGGDEFTLLLHNLNSLDEAINAAREIDGLFLQAFSIDGQEIFSSVSIGIACSQNPTSREALDLPSLAVFDQPDSILRNAEIAMYQAKVQGKARYAIFNSNLHQSAIALLQLETDLRQAVGQPLNLPQREIPYPLRTAIGTSAPPALNLQRQDLFLNREFRVHYQPIVDLQSGKIVGFEALIRWQHPQRGLISPVEFIPLAEETGLITILGEWVLRRACEQLTYWHKTLHCSQPLVMTVNLSPAQLKQPNLPRIVAEILADTGLTPKTLKLEITESGLMENIDIAMSLLQQLTKLGVQLSIDDFGIGYSSLGRLQHLPFNTLKIDQSFVRWMGFEDESLEIVQTILTLAHNLGMNVVAEGIETFEQLSQLRRLHCDYGQGYLFSRPIEAIAATTLLTADPRW